MANIFKFEVTDKVKNTLGLGFANVAAGDVFYLTDAQLKKYPSVRNAIELGYVTPQNELGWTSENTDALTNAGYTGTLEYFEYLDGITPYKLNMIPASAERIVPPLASGGLVNTVAADLAGGYTLGRKVAISGFEARFSTTSVVAPATGTSVPRLLATAGDYTPVTPSLLTGYDYTAGTYTAATNGSIAAAAPITWAANDMLIIGYTEKFASVMFNMTTECSAAGRTSTAYYWDGDSWVAFPSFTDFTPDINAGTPAITLSRVGNTDNARMVWWEMPDNWVAGGPNGSLATSSDYCVGILFDGALTALAGCSVYPILDTPIADINVTAGTLASPAAVIQKLGAAYNDETGVAVAWDMSSFTTTDYLWIGFTSPAQGFIVDVTNTNSNAVTKVVTYWNGQTWATAPTVVDGTENAGATFAKDGAITMATIPTDWCPAAATTTTTGFPGANTPTTVSTDELYWIRYTVSGAMDASVSCVIVYGVPAKNYWHEFAPEKLTFVDDDDEIHVWVVDENTTINALSINALVADI